MIAWCAGIFSVLAVIGLIVTAVQVAHRESIFSGGVPTVSASCASQGGWDPTC